LEAVEFDELGFDTTGLVGYWQLNGNAHDSSGQGNNGTIVGATATTDRFGTANMALAFDGINQYVSLGAAASPLKFQGQFTIAGWFNASTFTVGPSDADCGPTTKWQFIYANTTVRPSHGQCCISLIN
jgi:hypothetical protein